MESSCKSFGVDLLRSICKNEFDKNIIYSPMSIYMALGMTLYGAINETETEMMTTLHWDKSNSNSFHKELSDCIKMSNVDDADKGAIKIANKLFLENQYQLLDLYVNAIDQLYNGGIEKMDFLSNPDKSCKEINLWVEQQTNGKIKDLLQPGNIKKSTKLILVNAIYFKGSWIKKFDLIGQKDFRLLNNTIKSTEMMSNTERYKYLDNSQVGFSAVQIPFNRIKNIVYSLMLILPNHLKSLPDIEKSIFQHKWESILGDDLFQNTRVQLTVPKFKIECSFSLKDELINLGMITPFTAGADFSRMTGNRDLMIDDVIHKAFIDVDENGVEAAAATAIRMMKCSGMINVDDPIDFTCDRPFMFALIKDFSLPLFIGHFTQC